MELSTLRKRSVTNSSEKEEAQSGTKKSRTNRWLDFVISLSLFMLFLGLPIFFLNLTFQGIVFEKQIYFYFWSLIALVSFVTKGVITGEMKIKKTPLDVPLGIFYLAYALATIFSIDRWHSFWGFFGDPSLGLMSLTVGILVYYISFSHLNRKRINWMIGAIAISGIGVSFWSFFGLMDFYGIYSKLEKYISWNFVGSTTSLTVFLSLIIPVLIAIILKMTLSPLSWAKRIAIIVMIMAILVNFASLFILFSFLPIVGIFIGISFFLIFVLARIITPKDSWSWLPMLAFIILIVIWLIDNDGFNLARIQIQPEAFPTKNVSWEIAKGGVSSGIRPFFLGAGPTNYGYVFSLHRPDSFIGEVGGELRFYRASGMFFEVLGTTGILGEIGLLLILLTFVSSAIYLLAKNKQQNKIISVGLVASALVFLADTLWTRIDGGMMIFGSLVSILALVSLIQESQTEEKSWNLSLKISPKFALTLAFIFMLVSVGVIFLFVFIGKALIADIYMHQSMKLPAQEFSEADKKMDRAIANSYSLESNYFLRRAQVYMAQANQEAMKDENSRDLKTIASLVNGSISLGEKAESMSPKNVAVVFQLAQLYESAAIYDPTYLNSAKDKYSDALSLEPKNPTIYLKLGQIDVALASTEKDDAQRKSDLEEAQNYMQQSVSVKKDFSEGLLALAAVKKSLGDLDGAVSTMEQAFQSAPSNITYAFNLAEIYKARGKDSDYAQAENIYKQILNVNPQEINTLYGLGTLYEKMNKTNDALTYFQKTLDVLKTVAPDDKKAQDKMNDIINQVKNGGNSNDVATSENKSVNSD